MVNLLLYMVVEKGFNSNTVRRIKEEVKPDHLHMIVAHEDEMPAFEQYGECIFQGGPARGAYSEEQMDLEHSIPLEEDLLSYMDQHSVEIMYQQRRFELHPDYPVDASLDSHYTVYRHNLFFWYNFLKRKQITHVFLAAVPHYGYDCIIYYLCKYLQIPVLIVHWCFIPFRQYPLADFTQDSPELKAEYEKLLEQYKDTELSEIPLEGKTVDMFHRWTSREAGQMTPWYMRTDPFVRRLRQRFYETNIIRIWRGMLGEDHVKYGFGIRFWATAFRKIPSLCGMIPVAWKRYRLAGPVRRESIRFRDYYQSLAGVPEEGEKYIYFAMHFQPEASSDPMGKGMYADQLIPLQILSKALPEDVKIYAKIHPEQLSLMRTKEYYDELASVPNVRLMKVECSTYELMNQAMAVASLTGTALWECQFFGVPALAFGYSEKNMAPLTYPVRTVEDCRKALEEIIKNPRRDALKELKLYAKAMHNVSFAIEEIEEKYPETIQKFILNSEKDQTRK